MTLSIFESVFFFIKKHGRQLLYEVSPVGSFLFLLQCGKIGVTEQRNVLVAKAAGKGG